MRILYRKKGNWETRGGGDSSDRVTEGQYALRVGNHFKMGGDKNGIRSNRSNWTGSSI